METPFVIFAMIIFLLGWGIGLADLFTRNKKKAKGIWKLRELEEEISLRKEEKEKIKSELNNLRIKKSNLQNKIFEISLSENDLIENFAATKKRLEDEIYKTMTEILNIKQNLDECRREQGLEYQRSLKLQKELSVLEQRIKEQNVTKSIAELNYETSKKKRYDEINNLNLIKQGLSSEIEAFKDKIYDEKELEDLRRIYSQLSIDHDALKKSIQKLKR